MVRFWHDCPRRTARHAVADWAAGSSQRLRYWSTEYPRLLTGSRPKIRCGLSGFFAPSRLGGHDAIVTSRMCQRRHADGRRGADSHAIAPITQFCAQLKASSDQKVRIAADISRCRLGGSVT
jgi:hypothetical protein